MHLNQLASSPTPFFFGGWIYRLYKTSVQRMPKSFRKGPWLGKVDLVNFRLMGIIYVMGDGTVRFQTTQRHVWNPKEALVLHANPLCPPPQFMPSRVHPRLKGVVFLTFKVCIMFCRKTSNAPATPITWSATPTPGSEQWRGTSPKSKMTSATFGSTWCIKEETMKTRTWIDAEALEEVRHRMQLLTG
ncbi:hypothetical protein Hanom_Chr01g00039981 [Helianthus anomalus]